jgi:hypothetical protein
VRLVAVTSSTAAVDVGAVGYHDVHIASGKSDALGEGRCGADQPIFQPGSVRVDPDDDPRQHTPQMRQAAHRTAPAIGVHPPILHRGMTDRNRTYRPSQQPALVPVPAPAPRSRG